MKLLLFLFSFYLLALGFLPCADEVCAQQQNTVATSFPDDHSSHSEEICPPFCTCSCCSTHILVAPGTDLYTLPFQQPADTRKITFSKHPLLSGAGNSIWQPPRLG